MQTETDIFLTGFLGGICGASILLATMYYHIKYTVKKYLDVKDIPAELSALRRTEFEIEKMKVKLSDLDKKLHSEKPKKSTKSMKSK